MVASPRLEALLPRRVIFSSVAHAAAPARQSMTFDRAGKRVSAALERDGMLPLAAAPHLSAGRTPDVRRLRHRDAVIWLFSLVSIRPTPFPPAARKVGLDVGIAVWLLVFLLAHAACDV